jgi:hypothetical protein
MSKLREREIEIWTLRSESAAADVYLHDVYLAFRRRVLRVFGGKGGYVALFATVPGDGGPAWGVASVDLDGVLKRLCTATRPEDAISGALAQYQGDGPPGPFLEIENVAPRALTQLLRLRVADRVVALSTICNLICQRCGRKRCNECTAVHPGLGIPQLLAERGKVSLYHAGDPSDLSGKVPSDHNRSFAGLAVPETKGIPNDLMEAAAAAADRWRASTKTEPGFPLGSVGQRDDLVRFIAAEMVQVVAHTRRR